ncbi:MAG: asparaginase [Methanoregula sp.]|nr:asparaginase [Methanoregula sp.]
MTGHDGPPWEVLLTTPGIRAILGGILLAGMLIAPIAASESPQKAPLPNILILATGGTIAGTAQNSTDLLHYIPGNLSVESLIASVPEIQSSASVTGEQVCNINSDDITPEIWLDLARRINARLDSAEIDGIVVTHGTDTLEETAYFLNLVTSGKKPVVITGSMRPSTALSADGPLNLLNAVQLAGSADARGKGVLIALNGEINGARDTTKTSTRSTDSFRSPDFGRLGYMVDGEPMLYRLPARNHTSASEFNVTGRTTLPRVDIVLAYPGMDATAIDAFVREGTDGLVIVSMGNGEYPRVISPVLQSVARKGIPVVISSRTGTGITTSNDGLFISADTLTPQKARILLMLALTETHDRSRIAKMFRTY